MSLPPITERLFKAAEQRRSAFFASALQRPRLFMGTALAAAAAPLLFKNDERGYIQTSLITTPAILAAAAVGGPMFRAARSEGERLTEVFKSIPKVYGFKPGLQSTAFDINELRRMWESGSLSLPEYNRMLTDFFADVPAKASNLRRERGAFSGILRKLIGDPTKQRLLSNAFHAERLRNSGAAELVTWDPQAVAPLMTPEEMVGQFRKYGRDPEWLRGMNFRMQQASRVTDMGGQGIAAAKLKSAIPAYIKWDGGLLDTAYGREMMAQQHPALLGEVESLLNDSAARRALALSAGDLEVAVMPGRNRAGNQIVGLRIKKDLVIPIIGQDGSVRLGADFENVGVSRFFITHNEHIPADIYAVRNLRYGKKFVREELNRAQFMVGKDPLDDAARLYQGDGLLQANPRQVAFYSKQGIMANAPGSFADGGWDVLRPERRVEEVMHQVDQGLIKVTGGTNIEIMEKPDLAAIEPHGFHNREKESLKAKAMNKAIEAEVEAGVTDPWHPKLSRTTGFSRTTGIEDLAGVTLPEFGIRTSQVSPSQWALFGDLREWDELHREARSQFKSIMQTLVPERNQAYNPLRALPRKDIAAARRLAYQSAFQKLGMSDAALRHIAADTGMGIDDASRVWQNMVPWLSNRSNYTAMRHLGYLGEGSRLLAHDAVPGGVKRTMLYKVHQNALDAERLNEVGFFGAKDVIGYHFGNPVFASGEKNYLKNVFELGDGMVGMEVEEWLSLSGAKTHGLTKQTISPNFDSKTLENIRQGLNRYHQEAGTGVVIPREIQGYSLFQYNSDKAVNPMQALHDLTGDLFRRLEETGQMGEVAGFAERLKGVGLEYVDGQVINRVSGMGKEMRVMDARLIIRQMFDHVSERLRNHKIVGDQMMQAASEWMTKGEGRTLDQFMMQYALPESLSISDHMKLNHAGQVKVTRDALQQIILGGDYELAKELESRLVTDGSTAMTRDFMAATDPSLRDLSKPFGEAVLSTEDAVGTASLQLGEASGRIYKVGEEVRPTIFDPAHPISQKNYSIKLTTGEYLPVLGREAYGGKANHYGLQGFSPNPWEKELGRVLDIDAKVKAGERDASALATVRDEYLNKIRSELGVGKDSFLRAERVDPLGFEGRFTARMSTARYENGAVNPFEIGIGREYLSYFSESERNVLLAGERLEGVVIRHPINATVQSFVKWDPTLDNSFQIGADPLLQLINKGDSDGDRVSFHLAHDKHLKGNIENPGSLQSQMLELTKALEGIEADPREFAKPFADSPFRKLDKFVSQDLRQALRQRTAAADVGMLSNTMERLETSLAHNPLFRNGMEKMVAHKALFDIVRQSSIAAQKLKAGGRGYDLTSLMGWNNALSTALENRTERGMNTFYETLLAGAESFGKEIPFTARHAEMGLQPTEAGTVNAYRSLIESQKDMFLNVWHGHDPATSAQVAKVTMGSERAAKFTGDIVADLGDTMPALQAASRRGAEISTGALGAINAETKAARVMRAAHGTTDEVLHSVSRVAGAARGHGAGKTLAIGAGIAAGAGLLFGSLHSPREGQALAPTYSANRFRPEERVGVDGAPAGEPEAGAMAPANPPRTVREATGSVRTAVVAPVRRRTDLEVKMQSDDPSRSAEAAKMMARMATDGDSHVTVNYRDNTNIHSLRMREKMRDALDR